MPTVWVTDYGYIGLFVALLAVPIPGEGVLGFTGYLVYTGQMRLAPALAAACLGNLTGITIAYWVGRLLGQSVLDRYGDRLGLTQRRLIRTRVWFQHLGRWALPFGYFIPGMRDLLGLTSGVTGLRYHVFALFAYPGGVAWPVTYITLGYFLGEGWVSEPQRTRELLELGGGAVGGLIFLYVLIFTWRRGRRRRRRSD